ALLAAALLDCPSHIGLDRRGGLVEIVAVEAETGFQAQRIARAEAGRRHFRLRQQAARQRLGPARRHGYLVAVLAGVAGAADQAVDAVERDRLAVHEAELLHAGREARQRRRRTGALQRDQRAVIELAQRD